MESKLNSEQEGSMPRDNTTVCRCHVTALYGVSMLLSYHRLIALSWSSMRHDNAIVRQFSFLTCYRTVVLQGFIM